MKRKKKSQRPNGFRTAAFNDKGHDDLTLWRRQKLSDIQQALSRDPVDIETLRHAAVSEGGLLTNDVRRKVWPKLLNVNAFQLPASPGKDFKENHKDYNQVLLDVWRSMRRFPKGMPADEREVLQEQLIHIILEVLTRNPHLHYYQGYHDIAVTFLLVVGKRMAVAMVEKLSNHHLRDFMDPTMDSTKQFLNYLMPILEHVDPELHHFMLRAEVGTIFALSWLITWYGHVLSDFRHVLRLYDFFLASHPLMAIYFAAVVVLYREREVKSTECDMASVHHLLSQIPQDLPYEQLIARAHGLFTSFPPARLNRTTTLRSHTSLAIGSFQDFQRSTLRQRPDSVLLRQRHKRSDAQLALAAPCSVHPQPSGTQQVVKVAVWGISAMLGAAVLAVVQSAMDWDVDLFQHFF